MKNLVLRTNGYHVELAVPKALRETLGRRVLRVNLHTRDEMRARTLRDRELTKLRAILADAALRAADHEESTSRVKWMEKAALAYGESIYADDHVRPLVASVDLLSRPPAAPLIPATPVAARVVPTFRTAATHP